MGGDNFAPPVSPDTGTTNPQGAHYLGQTVLRPIYDTNAYPPSEQDLAVETGGFGHGGIRDVHALPSISETYRLQ